MKYTLALSGVVALNPQGLYRVEVIRCGKWDYPRPGSPGFEITPETIAELKSNFDSGIMGSRVPLNIDHKDGRDCGWVHGLEVSPNGQSLYALFDVTHPEIKSLVDTGTLAFCSAELDFERVCPELSAMGDLRPRKVLEGLALTNHPYIKRMEPISTAIMLSDRAALAAAQAHYPGLATEDDPDETQLGGVTADPIPGGTMNPVTLTDYQTENAALKAKLAAIEGSPSAATALAETRRLQAELKLRDTEAEVKTLIRRGKLTPAVARKFLRMSEVLIRGGASLITLSEPVSGRKYKLSDDEDDALDKLDVIQEVVGMLGQLPDAVAMDSTTQLAEDDGYDPDPEDDEEAMIEKANEIQATDPKMSRREAHKRARAFLAEKKGGRVNGR